MSVFELILIGIGLAMDAFAVSVCKGLSMKKMNYRKAIIIALYFGVFQALMPIIGYFLGIGFKDIITQIDHWIAFILLAVIGLNMIRESIKKDDDEKNDNVDFKTMIVLAIATSIDALAVGITFAFLKVDVISSVILIRINYIFNIICWSKNWKCLWKQVREKGRNIWRNNINYYWPKNFIRAFKYNKF